VARLSFLLLLCAEPTVSVVFFPLCSVLFLLSHSGSAGVGNTDGGGMAVLLWRWKGNTAVVPGGRGMVLLLLCAETTSLCSSLPHFCFGFLSSVSQTNLPLLFLVPFCFGFSLLYTRNPPSSVLLSFGFFYPPPSRLSLVSTPLVFIGKRRESPHCLVPSCMAQEGNRVTLPLQGKVAGCLQGMVPLSWQGMVVWVWVLTGFLCKWEEEKVSRKKIFKNPLLPCLCICKGEELHSAVQKAPGSLVFFFLFFLRKEK